MKRLLLILTVLTAMGDLVLAPVWHNNPRVVPIIALPDAYRQAMAALGPATITLHCTTAQFETPGGGFWSFRFYDTNAALKTVWVHKDSTQVIDGEPPH